MNDREFINEKINNEQVSLPETLNESAVAELVSETAQAKPKKRYRAALVSLAAALVILVGVMVAVKVAGKIPRRFQSAPDMAVPMEQNQDYSELSALLEKQAKKRERSSGIQFYDADGWLKSANDSVDAVPSVDAEYAQEAAMPTDNAASVADQDYSGLNTRTEGVDETDTVRTDGRFIYVLSSRYYNDYYYGWVIDEYAVDEAETERAVLDPDEDDPDEAETAAVEPAEPVTAEAEPETAEAEPATAEVEPETAEAEPETAEAAPVPPEAETEEKQNGQRFFVVDPNGGNMQTVSVTELVPQQSAEDDVRISRYFDGFYLYGQYAVLTGRETTYEARDGEDSRIVLKNGYAYDYGYYPYFYYGETRGIVCVYDLSDPANVTLTKELWFDTEIVDTRITEGRLITVSSYYPYAHDFKADDYTTFVPYAGDCYVAPDCIYVGDEEGDAFFTVTVTDLDGGYASESVSVLGNAYDFYCTGKNVYAYASKSEYKGPVTGWVDSLQLYKITADGAVPQYIAKTQFEGARLRDDYAIDEYNGTLRLALQCWNNSETELENYIVIVDESLNVLGQTEAFGEGETIESVRFSENLCYAVTFYQTDPLFVFDLTDPSHPVKRGELKLPGFSAYMHPAGEGYMIGVGQGGTDDGLDGSAKISLFNVSDPENPVETDQIVLREGWFYSDHKSFIVRGENGYIVTFQTWGDDSSHGGALYFTVENGKLVEQSRCLLQNEWVNGLKALFIGDVLYLYNEWSGYSEADDTYRSGEGISSFNIDTGVLIATMEF